MKTKKKETIDTDYSVIFGIRTKDYNYDVLTIFEIVPTEKIIEILNLNKKEWEQKFIELIIFSGEMSTTGYWINDRSKLKKYGLIYWIRLDNGYDCYRICGTENKNNFNYYGDGENFKKDYLNGLIE